MNVFMFQSTVARYDLRKGIIPGANDTWYATRYRNEMHQGDTVFFWMGGTPDTRGLYGWGHITSIPYVKSGWESYGVDVNYEVKFSNPILARSFHDDKVLSDLLIFRAPQATNFLLSADQATRVVEIVKNRGEKAPSLGDDKR